MVVQRKVLLASGSLGVGVGIALMFMPAWKNLGVITLMIVVLCIMLRVASSIVYGLVGPLVDNDDSVLQMEKDILLMSLLFWCGYMTTSIMHMMLS